MLANTKILDRIEFLGYCCPKEFYRAHEKFTNEELAMLLCLSPRTIRFWRSRVRVLSPCKACGDISLYAP